MITCCPMKAIGLAVPGDVIVVSGGFDVNYSVWGGIMSTMAKRRGIAGVLTDGLVRDAEQTRTAGLTVFAAGLTPVGPSKDGRGQIGLPISCGGTIIHPGDIVVGDTDGVVVVPPHEAEAVLARAHDRVALEDSWLADIEQDKYMLIETDDELVCSRLPVYRLVLHDRNNSPDSRAVQYS